MRRISTRQQIDRAPLSEPTVEQVMRRHLVRRSETAVVDYAVLLDELRRFGITTKGQFRRLLTKHKRVFRAEDNAAMRDPMYVRTIAEDLGPKAISDRRRRQYWFGWEAQVRSALEHEFGTAYEEFARARDGL